MTKTIFSVALFLFAHSAFAAPAIKTYICRFDGSTPSHVERATLTLNEIPRFVNSGLGKYWVTDLTGSLEINPNSQMMTLGFAHESGQGKPGDFDRLTLDKNAKSTLYLGARAANGENLGEGIILLESILHPGDTKRTLLATIAVDRRVFGSLSCALQK